MMWFCYCIQFDEKRDEHPIQNVVGILNLICQHLFSGDTISLPFQVVLGMGMAHRGLSSHIPTINKKMMPQNQLEQFTIFYPLATEAGLEI